MFRVAVLIATSVWLLADATPARAQILYGPVGYNSFGYRSGFRFGFAGPNFAIGGGWGRSYYSSYPVYGPVAVGPWGGFGGVGVVGPNYYYGPGYFGYNNWYGPPVIVQPPPVVIVQAANTANNGYAPRTALAGGFTRHPDADFQPEPRVEEPVKRADFVVVRPQGERPVPIAAGAKKPLERDNQFVPNLEGAFAVDRRMIPADPKRRVVFEVQLARQAFAMGEYGRAGERLAAATQADPTDPIPYFLLAQVRTARGEYAEAVAAIRDGMKHAPDWPAEAFRLREIYGPAANRFDEHLTDLRTALRDHPDNPTLLFLLGYQLWFLGEKAEAGKLFKRAAERVRDGGVIERFVLETDGRKA